MAAEAEATREAKAKIIQADGEMNAAKSLREAAVIIAECPQGTVAFQNFLFFCIF